MASANIFNTLELLDSSKIKERNEGLHNLSELIDSDQPISPKNLTLLAESLFSLIDNEKSTFLKNETPAALTRLNEGAYVLRRLILKNPKELKLKLVDAILEFVQSRFFDSKGGIFTHLAVNLSKILHGIVAYDAHRNNISSSSWYTLVNMMIRALYYQLGKSTTEKFLPDLLMSLKHMLKETIVNSADDLTGPLSNLVSLYFNKLKNDDSSTPIMLEISNQALVLMSTTNATHGLKVVKSIIKASSHLIISNYEALKDQFIIFCIISSEYIGNSIPKVIDEDGAPVAVLDVEFRETLVHLLDTLLQNYAKNIDSSLAIDMIQFSNSETRSWFDFQSIRAHDSNATKPWISLFALVSLLNALFRLEKIVGENEVQQGWKRRRLDDSFVEIIDRSTSSVEFIDKVLESSSASIQLLGLKLLVFHIHNFKTDSNAIDIEKAFLYNKSELSGWVSLTIKTLLEYGWQTSNEVLSQALTVNLQMLKDPKMVDVASQTCIQIISSAGFALNDRSLSQLLGSIFEISQINGPARLTNSSIRFWVIASDLAKVFSFGEKKSGDKIIDWLLSKWDTINFKQRLDDLPSIIAWLVGSAFSAEDSTEILDSLFTRFYQKWAYKKSLSRFILRNKIEEPTIRVRANFDLSPPVVDKFALESVIDKLLHTLTQLDGIETAPILVEYIGYSLSIYQSIAELPELVSPAERIKYDIRRLLENLNPSSPKIRSQIVRRLNHYKVVKDTGLFVVDHVNNETFIPNPSVGPQVKHVVDSDDFSGFGSVRKSVETDIIDSSLSYHDLNCIETPEQEMIKLILSVNSNFNTSKISNSAIDQAVMFLNHLSSEQFCHVFYTLLNSLKDVDLGHVQTTSIRLLLRQFGTKLLTSYEFQRSPIGVVLMADFVFIFSKVLLSKDSADLVNDFSDIFDWYLSMAKKGNISEEYSLAMFLRALFELLGSVQDLQFGNPSEITELTFKLLYNSSPFIKQVISSSLEHYLLTLPWKKRYKVFDDLIDSYPLSLTDEVSASLLLCLQNVSSISYPFFTKAICFIITHYQHFHFQPYAQDIISDILQSFELGSFKALSTIELLEIFDYWYSEIGSFDDFPFDLFGYSALEALVKDYDVLLYSIINSKTTDGKNALFTVVELSGKDSEDLQFQSISFLLPLAYTHNGLRGSMNQYLNDTFDETMVEYQSFIIIYNFLQLIDVSDESEFFKFIPRLDSLPYLSSLASKSSAVLYSKVNVSVSFSDALHQISRLTKKEDMWSSNIVLFLINNILRGLQISKSEEEGLLILRKLKLVLILGVRGFQSQSDDALFALINSLSPYLTHNALHQSVAKLIVCAIKIYPGNVIESKLYPSGLFKLFYQVSNFRDAGNTVDPEIQELVIGLYNMIDSKRAWKSLLSPFIDILKGSPIRLTLDILHQTLKYSSQVTGNVELKSHILEVMTLVFRKSPELSVISYGFKTNRDVARLLLEASNSEISRPVAIFISRYLGRYYLETGDELHDFNEDFERSIEYDIDSKSKTLRVVFDELVKIKVASKDLEEVIMIDKVLGNLLYDYNRDPLLVEPFVDFEAHLSPFAKSLLPLDSFTFGILAPYTLPVPEIKSLVGSSFLEELTFLQWSQKICVSLLTEIQQNVPVAAPLIKYLSSFPGLSVKIMNHLWLLYARSSGHAGGENLLRFVVNSASLASSSSNEIGDERIKLLLNLCFFIRLCAKENIKPFPAVYRKLDLANLYELATFCGLNKLALVLFEEKFNSQGSSDSSLGQHSEVLTSIYEGLNDIDLLFGLPVDPSLDYAINIFNKTEENSWKRIMFNSATFDSSVLPIDITNSRDSLLRSLASNSINGLSNLVNDFVDPFEKLSNGYEWCWKLDKWDLPVVPSPQTESEYVYNALKSVKEKKSTVEVESSCQSIMSQLLSLKNSQVPLLKTLCTIYNVETINSLSTLDLGKNMLDSIACTENWFKFATFSSFENLLISRKILFANVEQNIGRNESLIATAHEVARYGTFARLHNEMQRSANSAVLLANTVKIIEEDGVKLLLSKLSNFESACTLWGQGETVIPIAMLEKNTKVNVQFDSTNIPVHIVEPSNSILNAYLVKWNSESKQKKFEDIMEEYVEAALSSINKVANSKGTAEIFHTIGYFCYKQTKRPGVDDELKKREKQLNSKKIELKDLRLIIEDGSSSDRDKKEAKRYYQKLILQYESDKDSYGSLYANKKLCTQKAIEFFLKAIAVDNSFDEEDIDKLCALWLENSDNDLVNEVVQKEICNVASYKFIPWINQLVSRLSNENSQDSSKFQVILQELLIDICYRHPYHSLYFIKNLELQKNYEISVSDKSISSRINSASNIWNRLKQKGSKFTREVLLPVDHLATSAMELANFKISKTADRKVHLENLKIGEFWLKSLPSLNVPLPTTNYVPISLSGDYSSIPRISSVHPHVSISPSGISLPKILKVTINDGSTHRLLLKGGTDDLRQDSIMEQVFEKVNIILQNDKMTRNRNLKIRTYKVVPLGPTSGMIEFVADSIALSDILRPLHLQDKISFDDARIMMKGAQGKNARERIAVYKKICKDIPPAFSRFFHDTFVNVDDWYKSRQVYTKGIVTTSIVGHVLGLGDRHLNNILIDKKTGEPIHIDLGVAFDQGKLLPIPELVPFRLTRDLVDGLGVTGVKGSFEKSSEHVFRVLRENAERIISILDVLKYDPLYIWAISPIRKRRLQDNEDSTKSYVIESDDSDAGRAVKGVEDKLIGNGLSVDATVQQLIQEATDIKNLAVIYLGWSPFY